VGRSSDPGFGVGAATIPSERIRSRLPIQTVNGRADLWRKWGSAPTSDYAGPKTARSVAICNVSRGNWPTRSVRRPPAGERRYGIIGDPRPLRHRAPC
jgi:hypothetical protein